MEADLSRVLELLSLGKYVITLHARLRMSERNIIHSDIKSCGASGIASKFNGKIKVNGFDCDGSSLSIICVIEEGVIIITVF